MRAPLPHPWLLGLTTFAALTSIAGGIALLISADGASWAPLSLLAKTPFRSFFVPGALLAGVVGSTSLVAALLHLRRHAFAIDASAVAGGAMTIWIVVESALFQAVHWLQVLYGSLGLCVLGLSVHAALRSRLSRHRWLVYVSFGEALGFMVPLTTGILTHTAGLHAVAQAGVVSAAGAIEGLALGLAQASAFTLPIRRVRYAMLSAAAACAVWAMVMFGMLLADRQSGAGSWALALLASPLGLIALGGMQWLELRRHVPRAWPWIAWTALAWICALPMSLLPTPLVDEQTPWPSLVAIWSCGGLLMGFVMALITWQGARRLLS